MATLIGIITATVIWVAIWVLGNLALYILDIIRGLSEDSLQKLARNLFSIAFSGTGGYFGMYMAFLKNGSHHIPLVFIGFSAVVAFLLMGSLFAIVPIADRAGIGPFPLAIQFLEAIAAIIGAFIAHSTRGK